MRWERVAVPEWYGGRERAAEVCPATAVRRHAGLPVVPIRRVLPRDPRGRLDPQALPCTDPARDPRQVVRRFVQRWRVGAERCSAPFREVRDHLGVGTRRQWSDHAIARATPRLLALFSIITSLAARLDHRARSAVCTAAWYREPRPTFADAPAAVRRRVWAEQGWAEQGFLTSRRRSEVRKPHPALRHGIAYAPCHAA